MDQVHQVIRYRHYAYRTEQTYCDWIIRFIKFYDCKTHPALMGKQEIDKFLSYLATEKKFLHQPRRITPNGVNPKTSIKCYYIFIQRCS